MKGKKDIVFDLILSKLIADQSLSHGGTMGLWESIHPIRPA